MKPGERVRLAVKHLLGPGFPPAEGILVRLPLPREEWRRFPRGLRGSLIERHADRYAVVNFGGEERVVHLRNLERV